MFPLIPSVITSRIPRKYPECDFGFPTKCLEINRGWGEFVRHFQYSELSAPCSKYCGLVYN